MKICVLSGYYPEGGAGKVAYQSAKELSKKHDVHFLFCDKRKKKYLDGKLRVESLVLPKKQRVWHNYFNFRIYRQLKNKLKNIRPDVIHFHNIQKRSFSLLTLYFLSKKYKTFWTLHDQWAFCLWSYPRPIDCKYIDKNCLKCKKGGFLSVLNRKLKDFVYKISDLEVIVPSKWLKKQCKKSSLRNKKIHKINYGIEKKNFVKKVSENKLNDIKKGLGIKKNDKIILFVGDMQNKRKGWDLLIKAVKSIKKHDIKILLLGEKPINNKDLKNIIFTDYIPNKKVHLYYKIADLFVLPTRIDNQPVTIIESMFSKVPVISTNKGGIPEMIRDHGLISNIGIKELKEKILLILDNKVNVNKIIKKAYNFSLKEFNLKKQTILIEKAYGVKNEAKK